MEKVVWTRFSGNNYDAEVLMSSGEYRLVPYNVPTGIILGWIYIPEKKNINGRQHFVKFLAECEKEQKDVRYCKDGVICVKRGMCMFWEYGEERGIVHVPEVLMVRLDMKYVENMIMKNVNYNINDKLVLMDITRSICTSETKLFDINFSTFGRLVLGGFFPATNRMRKEIRSLEKSLETSEKSRQQTESEKSTAAAAFREKAQSLEEEMKKWQDRHKKSEESRLQLETALREIEQQKSKEAVEFEKKIQSLVDMNKKLEESVVDTEQALYEMKCKRLSRLSTECCAGEFPLYQPENCRPQMEQEKTTDAAEFCDMAKALRETMKKWRDHQSKSEKSRQQTESEKSTAAAEFSKKIQSLEEEIDGLQASQLNAEQSLHEMLSSVHLSEQSRQQMKSSLQLALKSLDTAFKQWTEKELTKKEKTAGNKEETKWLEKAGKDDETNEWHERAAFFVKEATYCLKIAMGMDEPESDEEEGDDEKTQ